MSKDKKVKVVNHSGGGAVYGLGGIGALIYNLQGVSGLQPVVIAVLKSIVWPAFLIYKVYGVLGM